MAKEKMTMTDVEPLDLGNTAVAEESPPEPAEAENKESADPDAEPEPTSFIEAFKSSQSGEDAPKAKAEPEAEPKADASEAKESRSAKDFRLIKEERDNVKRELEALKGEITSLKGTDQSATLKALEAERDDLSSRLKASSLERSPEFQNYYQTKINGIMEQIKSAAGEHGERAAQLSAMPDSEWRTSGLEEVFAELPASQQARMGALMARLDELNTEKSEQLANADQAYEAMLSGQNAEQDQRVEASRKVFEEVASEAGALEVFQNRDDDDNWNAGVAEMRNTAKNIFLGESTEQELARASLWAAAAPKYRELLAGQMELNKRLQNQIKELKGATPSVDAESASSAPAEEKDFITTFMEHQGLQ